MTDLAPCPFCGGPALSPIRYHGTMVTGCAGPHECPGTDVRVPLAAWNRRAAPASPAEQSALPRDEQEIDWRDRALRAEAQRDRMREALEPFAECAAYFDAAHTPMPDSTALNHSVTLGHFRKAALALLTEGGGDRSSVASRGGSPAAPVKSETQEGH